MLYHPMVGGPNQPQTLTGIETAEIQHVESDRDGPINLKPLQGLKQDCIQHGER